MDAYKEAELRDLIDKKVNKYYRRANMFNANGDFISKVRKGSKKRLKSTGIIGKAKDYVDDATRKELADKKMEFYKQVEMNNIDSLIGTQETEIGKAEENRAYYFKEYIPQIARAREKQEVIRLKGLNNFSLPRLVFMQFKKNCKASMINAVKNTADKIYGKLDEMANNRAYAEIMKLFAKRVKKVEEVNEVDSEIAKAKKDNPRAYARALDDLAAMNRKNDKPKMVDDDFIAEVSPRSQR